MADYWSDKVEAMLKDLGGVGGAIAWRTADRETIDEALTGKSPYSGNTRPDAGAHVAFNIRSVHVPAFASRREGRAYQNRYDASGRRIGEDTPHGQLDAREAIDVLLGREAGVEPESIYYGAVELNGSGIRYYGDVALILRPDRVATDTLVLDRNSFDLILDPLRNRTHPNGSWDTLAPARLGIGQVRGSKGCHKQRRPANLAGRRVHDLQRRPGIVEYDHLTSDEAIKEGIIINEYTFTVGARRFG